MRNTFVQQHDSTDCAAASLAMVCLHYKKEITITRLRDMMGTDLKGTNLVGLEKAAHELGFDTAAVRVDRDAFLSDFTLPCIAQEITERGMTHFVVVFKKFTVADDTARAKHMRDTLSDDEAVAKKAKKKEFVIIGDPGRTELEKMSIDEFYKRFTGVLLLLNPTSRFEQGKLEKGKMLRRFWNLLWPHRKLFFYTMLASVITTLLGVVSSVFSKILVDEILPYNLQNLLIMMILASAAISLTNLVIGLVSTVISVHMSIKIDMPMMLGYFSHIYSLPMKFFATRKTGDITTRYSDAGTIKDIITSTALTLFMNIVMACGSAVVLYRINSTLFGFTVFGSVMSMLLVFIYRQPFKRINEESMMQSAALNSQLIEGLRSVETIKGNATEAVEMENLEREYVKSLKIGLKSTYISTAQGICSSLINLVFGSVVMYVGIMQVLTGKITYGTYLAYQTLSGYFTSPISSIISLQYSIQQAQISMKRLSEIMDHELEQDPNKEYQELENMDCDVEFKNVTFRYGTRQPVLKSLSFTIPKGQKVALVGSSGSGKSTISKLLLKYYEPEEGQILLDGVDINEYSNASVRRAIAYVPQNIELFSKSIFDNIRIVKQDATMEQVKEAAVKADAHDFIRKLPMQYHTYLEEAGNGLSGGEKQRIALARAFLKDSSFFVLDESTSSLDFVTENSIFNIIYNKMKGRSMLIVAHRLSTIRNCDKIIVMDKGEIVETGTHDELLEKHGRYYTMWNMQQGIISGDALDEETEEVAAAVIEEDDDGEAMTY